MLIVIGGIGALLLVIGIIICAKFGHKLSRANKDWVYYLPNTIGTVILSITILVAIVMGAIYSNHIVIDNKIDLYKAENERIEEQISTFAEQYMDYESATFEKFKGNDAVTLVTMFPELRSNELIAKQIEVYVSNRQEIKALECEKLDYKVCAFWLFFGGK